jgi:hypothetical protein
MNVPRFACVFLPIFAFSPYACFAQSAAAPVPSASAWGQVLLAEGDRPIRHARVDFVSSTTASGDSNLTDERADLTLKGSHKSRIR